MSYVDFGKGKYYLLVFYDIIVKNYIFIVYIEFNFI